PAASWPTASPPRSPRWSGPRPTPRRCDGAAMSLIQDLGARLNAANADLPLGEVTAALDKLRATSALLAWVRQQSVNPMGVPELAGAIEHLEHAMAALHVAEDSVTGYLAAIG